MTESNYFEYLFNSAKPIHFVPTWMGAGGCLDHTCYIPFKDYSLCCFTDTLGRRAVLIPMGTSNVVIHEDVGGFRWSMAIREVRQFRVHHIDVGLLKSDEVENLYLQLDDWRWVFQNQR